MNNNITLNLSFLGYGRECVTPRYAPGLRTDNYVAGRLESEGFTCKVINDSYIDYHCELCERGKYSIGDNHCYPCPRGNVNFVCPKDKIWLI